MFLPIGADLRRDGGGPGGVPHESAHGGADRVRVPPVRRKGEWVLKKDDFSYSCILIGERL